MRQQTGLKNEIKVSELIQSGSLAIKTKNEFGVHVFSGSVSDDGILSGKLTKPKYNEDELIKSIDTIITELLPIEAPELPDTVLRVIYNEALFEIDDLREQVRLLNIDVSDLTAKVSELEIVTQSLRVELDGREIVVASVENQNRQSVAKVQSSIVELQNSIQKATSEAIQRVSLTARNELLEGQIEVLNEQLGSAQTQIVNLTNTINGLNGQITNLVSQTNNAQSQAAAAQQAAIAGSKKKKIICDLLYKQGYLPKHIWEADQKFGQLMMRENTKGLLGYLIWAEPVVDFLTKKPQYSKYFYLITKPWSEHMAYMMGVLPNDNKFGKVIHTIGNQFSLLVYNLYKFKSKYKIKNTISKWQLGI